METSEASTNLGPSPEGSRKRKRKTYSCVDCRRRKLKCDREQPCARCIKEGHAQTCVFNADNSMDWHTSEMEEPDPVFRRYVAQSSRRTSILQTEEPVDRSAATNGSETFSALKQKIEYLESRIATLESLQKTPTVTLPDRVTSRRKSQDDTRLEDEPHYFRGKGFKTYFLGPTNPSSMLKFFPEIHHFVKDPALLQTPLARVQKDLEDMRSREKERRRHRPPVEQNLLTLLPSREIVDRLTRLYFDTYEHIYRILHRPSFWAQYGCGDYHTWSESLVAIVLLVVATVNCLSTTELSFHDQNSSAREAAETWITSVELWLSRQSQKHVTMEFFQTHCLLLLAKRINCIKRKRAWTASGNLLRQAVSSGLHLEPSLIEKNEISVFEQEMRRRLWATIFEWDLDASTMRGVPPLASSVPSNCNAPLNINDDQMESSSELAPKAKPLNEKTETSFLKVSLQSLPLRVSLASTINDSNTHLSFEDILHYEARINEELDKLPMWVKEPNARTCSGLPSVFRSVRLEGALLDIQLRQYLIYLHNPSTRTGPATQKTYSRIACMTASQKILDYYFKLAAAGNNSLNLYSNSLYTGILTISLNMLLETQDATMARSLAVSLHSTVDQALCIFEDKVLRLGEWYQNFWLATAVFSIASCRLGNKEEESKDKAIGRIAKLYFQVLAFQTKQNPTPSASQTPLPSVSSLTPSQLPVGTDSLLSLELSAHNVMLANLPKLPPLQNGGSQYDFATINRLPDWDLDDLWGFETINS